MQKLLKSLVLTTIVLLSSSTSWCQTDSISSTGELHKDSVLIAYDDLRKVNGKLVELKYEKEINDSLRSIIKNDDYIIKLNAINNANLNVKIEKLKKQRNIIGGIAGGAIIGLIVSLLAK